MRTVAIRTLQTKFKRECKAIWVVIPVLFLTVALMVSVHSVQAAEGSTAVKEKENIHPQGLIAKPTPSKQALEKAENQTTSKEIGSKPIPHALFNIWPPDWSQFLSDLFSTFIGAALGFLVAIWFYRKSQIKEVRQQRERHIFVLQLLADEITRNQGRLNQMKSDLRTTPIPDYSVTLDGWQATSREVLEAIHDSNVAQVIVKFYDYLGLVASALLVYNRLALSGGDNFATARIERLPRIENLINEAVSLTAVAVQGLKTEIARLKSGKYSLNAEKAIA